MALTERETIREILESGKADRSATIMGWVRTLRNSKNFSFMAVNDGSCQAMFQVVLDEGLPNYESVKKVLTGASVKITGKVVESQGRGQSLEMQATEVTVLGEADENYPLQKKSTSREFLRDVAHFRPRTNIFGAIFRLRHALSYATHEFYHKEGFYYVHTPIITGIDAEGAGEMFGVSTFDMDNPPKGKDGKVDWNRDYFAKKTSLTVSGQLEAESMALGLGKVYTFGPTFRSENSNTARHLSEFWMIEPEIAFANLDDVANLAQRYLQYLIRFCLDNYREELEFLVSRDKELVGHIEMLETLVEQNFLRVTYTEAIDILSKSGEKFEFAPVWGEELQTEHERFLTEKHFNRPVIVTDYPKDAKAFYMKQNEDGKTVAAMDALVPGVGEIIGGSQREDDLEKLTNRAKELGMNQEALWWYLDLRRFGTCPHGGFGLGLERMLMYVAGIKNIRDAIAFPRTPRNAEF